MPVTARAVLGNSLGGGLWKDLTISDPVPASGSLDFDEIEEATFSSAYYIITASTPTRVRTMMYSLLLDNGTLIDSVFSSMGKGFSFQLSAALAAGTITVTASTTGGDPVTLQAIRLIQSQV